MKYIKAKQISYSKVKRSRDNVLFIVIHYTGVNSDSAEAEARYFTNGNTREAGAHFFIGQDGKIIKSVPLDHAAWSVGGKKYSDCSSTGGGKYYGICTNSNSVSIELCDNRQRDPSEKQTKAVIKCIKYIRKYCKNAQYVIRHFDVNGKHCPARMMDSKKWSTFKTRIFKESGMDK